MLAMINGNGKQVNGLIENYLRSERTIILAIVPANQDVATVDILERAKKASRSPPDCPDLRETAKLLWWERVGKIDCGFDSEMTKRNLLTRKKYKE